MTEENKEKKGDNIELPRDEFNALMDRISLLEKNQQDSAQGKPNVLRTPKEKYVRMRFIDGKPVVGFLNKGTDHSPLYVYSETDPNDKRNRILFVDLIIEGEEEPMKVNYNEFLRNSEQIKCKVVNEKVEQDSLESGVTKKKKVEDYQTVDEGYQVPLEVTFEYRTYTIETPDGEQITLPEDNLNL